jgi:hypothetical protein
MKLSVLALQAAVALCVFAAPGRASTITDNFSITDSSNALIASGSFSYESSKSGTLGYADLSAFSINIPFLADYDLAFVGTVPDYVYFGFSTVTHDFVTANISGPNGNFDSIMSAPYVVFNKGFFVNPIPGYVHEYYTGQIIPATNYTITQVSQTPIAGALPLFASALGGLGFFGWRRRDSARRPRT